MTDEKHADRLLMAKAANEIRTLRHRLEILEGKMEMVDLFACVLHTKAAQRTEGAAVDVAWELDQRADQIAATGQ